MENSERQSGTRASGGSPGATIARAPRGAALSCKGWQQEAALRMLMNSAGPDVAEQSEELIVTQDLGRVAADWDAFRASAKALGALQNDETLLVRGGNPVCTIRTRESAPRVLIADSDPAGNWTYIGAHASLSVAFEIFAAAARKYFDGSLDGKLVVAEGLNGMVVAASPLAATMNGAAFLAIDPDAERIKRRVKAGYCDVMVNDLDEALRILKNAVRKREPASVGLAANPFVAIPELASRGVVPDLLILATGEREEFDDHVMPEAARTLRQFGSVIVSPVASIADLLAPIVAEGAAPIRWVALSGEPSDVRRADRLLLETFPENENLRRWIAAVQGRVRYEGLPARSCVLRAAERGKFGVAINESVARGEFKAPILIVRDRTDLACAVSPLQSGDSSSDGSTTPPPDMDEIDSMTDLARGATWASFESDAGNAPRVVAQAVVADGTSEMSARIERVLSS